MKSVENSWLPDTIDACPSLSFFRVVSGGFTHTHLSALTMVHNWFTPALLRIDLLFPSTTNDFTALRGVLTFVRGASRVASAPPPGDCSWMKRGFVAVWDTTHDDNGSNLVPAGGGRQQKCHTRGQHQGRARSGDSVRVARVDRRRKVALHLVGDLHAWTPPAWTCLGGEKCVVVTAKGRDLCCAYLHPIPIRSRCTRRPRSSRTPPGRCGPNLPPYRTASCRSRCGTRCSRPKKKTTITSSNNP